MYARRTSCAILCIGTKYGNKHVSISKNMVVRFDCHVLDWKSKPRSLRTWSFDLIATFWIGKANPPCKGLSIISSDQNITILQKKTFANGPSPLVQLKMSGERCSTEIAIFIEHQSLQRATCSILRLKRH